MEQLLATFKTTIKAGQAMKLFLAKKEARRTWVEHYLYMVAVSDARGGADSLVLDKIVHHASPELMNVMRAKYDPCRVDYMRHAEELSHFAQSIELVSGAVGREVTAAHVDTTKDTRTCYHCGKVGHVQRFCPSEGTGGGEKPSGDAGSGDMLLALTETKIVAPR
ncbi:unnamed protein product [Hyaloperonospora brassicae]|uniref:CCHC-type domain-containing protein n=1 Tax=Hyaloperonospora brassicae TaxID=162125 RepID=A0AAV0UE91_HYABA|nr:unnamed protein product [Hyaloperonospora brassicae]